MKMNKLREQMSQAFIEALKENEIPWKRGWTTERPLNVVRNTEYRGVNSVWLSYTAEQKGYTDPRWCTLKQANSNGWKVKKGEHGTQVEFWSLYDTETKKKLTARESNLLKKELGDDFYDRVKPISSVYTVFNGEQIEGIPKWERTHESIKSDELLQKRDTLIENMGFTFHEEGNRAFYRMGDDSVTLPHMEQFLSVYDYMSVFLHESGHATGHKERLDRDLSGEFGSESYAREELRAEIASAFTSQTLGLGEMTENHMDNHKAYIQSWIDVLEKEPQELFAAIRDAEKISDYLIEKGEFFPEKQQKVELDMQKQQYVTEHQKELEQIPLEKTPVVINAFGGPGSGKSTACMDICQQLKKLGYNAEYVQEYAKELVYDKNWEMLDGSEVHQFEMLKEQVHRMDRLYGQADFIVTDSPILLNTIYNQELTAAYSEMVQELHNQFHNFSFFVERDKASFQQEGRIHNLEESIIKDSEIQNLLKNNDIYYGTYTHETIGKVVQNAVTTYSWLNGESGQRKKEGENIIDTTDLDKWDKNITLYDKSTDKVTFRQGFNEISEIDFYSLQNAAQGWDRYEVASGGKILFKGDVTDRFEEDVREGLEKTQLAEQSRTEMEESFMTVSENLAGRLWDEECSVYTREGDTTHLIDSRSELYKAGKGDTLYVRKEDFSSCMKKEFFPTVMCEWSEHNCFDWGKTYLVSEFNREMEKADQEWCSNNRGGEENGMAYAKVKFQINLSSSGEKIVERQDIGDGDGSMIDFLKETGGIRYQKAAELLEVACTLEEEFMNYQEKLNGIFQQEEGHLPHPEHALGNCQDEVLNTIQKQINRDRSRQGASKPVKRHLEWIK